MVVPVLQSQEPSYFPENLSLDLKAANGMLNYFLGPYNSGKVTES